MADDRVVAEIPKNGRDVIRVTVGPFNGHMLAHARIWAMGADGKFVPTRAGFAIKASLLPALIAGLEAAWDEASK